MSIHGPNLEEVFDFCDRRFGLKTVLEIGMQLIDRLAWMHEQDFVHRDMKPENILIAPPSKKNNQLIYLIDFGLSKRWRNPATGLHIDRR